MIPIDWDLTLDTILDEKCILFLGPEIFTTPDGKTLNQRLLEYLDFSDRDNVKVYQDGLFFFAQKHKRTETFLKIKRFFAEEDFGETTGLMQKIAAIPFHLIITVNHDNVLQSVFEKSGFPHKAGFYWKKSPANQKTPLPTKKEPLLYNMLGSLDKSESLVLTHDDLFDYLESIFQAQDMSQRLKDHIIHEAQSIIFLGVPFSKWYMQLILRILHMHKDEDFMRFAASQNLKEEIQTLCKEQFQINFIPENITEFIDNLYQLCEQRGLLREAGEGEASVTEKIKGLVASDELDLALEQMKTWLEDLGDPGAELLDDTVLLSSRFRRLKRKINQGLLSFQESSLEKNKVSSTLMELLSEAKMFE